MSIYDKEIEAFIRTQYQCHMNWYKVQNDWKLYHKYYKNRGTKEDYDAVLDYLKRLDEQQTPIEVIPWVVDDGEPGAKIVLPQNSKSCFNLYKVGLRNQGISETDILHIVESTEYALSKMKESTEQGNPVRGLFIGNVQSGKTANMGAVMSLAADYGYNLFIIFSGTIENLRVQTAERFQESLIGTGDKWQHLSNSDIDNTNTFINLDIVNHSYVYVCLKNPKRLENLLKWLNSNATMKSRLKVMVIDDEADSASINTNDITKDDWTTINGHIRDIVFGRSVKHKKSSAYMGMNYVGYTATPYANLLNENSPDSLFPFNFIYNLPTSDSYFGYEQFFGVGDHDSKTLDIIRNTDTPLTPNYCNDSLGEMTDSILWFICATAALRFKGYKSPLSMLIHTSMNQIEHDAVANEISDWFSSQTVSALIDKCKVIYQRETQRFSLVKFHEQFAKYPLFQEMDDYPAFDDIKSHITDLAKLDHIYLDEKSDKKDPSYIYSKHIHLCVDNCGNNGVNGDMSYLRIVYPKKDQVLDFAPAFIVIGGNTLARGLTIKGLVSTYFGRKVNNSDSLMQMARWFGYRRKYELYPRVWLSETIINKFKDLSKMDLDLREQIGRQSESTKPIDYNLTLRSYLDSNLKITSKGKMQSGVIKDFYGSDKQLTSYMNNADETAINVKVMDDFIGTIGSKLVKSESRDAFIYENASSAEIVNLLDKMHFSKTAHFEEYGKEWFRNHSDCPVSIIFAGINSRANGSWDLCNDNSVGKVQRTPEISKDNKTFNIGVLSSKADYVADIKKAEFQNESTFDKMKTDSDINKRYDMYRRLTGRGNRALLIVYRFVTSVTDLDTFDHIGLSIVYPCGDGKTKKFVRYGIK